MAGHEKRPARAGLFEQVMCLSLADHQTLCAALVSVGKLHEVHAVLEVKLQLGACNQVVATFLEHNLAVESEDANQGLVEVGLDANVVLCRVCLLYTSPSPRDS